VSPDASTVFVTGISAGPSGDDYATIAYRAATGARLWVRRYDGPGGGSDRAFAIGLSPDATRLFVTGTSEGVTAEAAATIAYAAATGARLWTARYDGPTHSGGGSVALAVSPGGTKVYVTGTAIAWSGRPIYSTSAYVASNGARAWTAGYAGLRKGADADGIAVGPSGARVFVTGHVVAGTFEDPYGSSSTDQDFATVAYAG
jgi:hypothetical protein